RCAAHTLQLTVDDALKRAKPISQLISKARNLAKKLRTQTFIYLIRKQNFKKPTLDCPTRWCSTIDMLENLLLFQDYCEELSVTKFQNFVTLKDDEWLKIKKICTALRPSKICTKRLQEEQLTLSEFFGLWFKTKVTTEALQTSFSKLIVEQMIYREENYNDILLSAVYMDPRYKVLLDNTQIQRAKTHLKRLWIKIVSVNHNNIENSMNKSNENSNGNSSNSSGTGSSYDEFENLLKLKEQQHTLMNSSSRESDLYLHRIENELERYNNEQKRISRRINILEFWEEKKQDQLELYKLAMIVLAVPATQVSVERLFSGLKFILSPLRTNISENILENYCLLELIEYFVIKKNVKNDY
ncbi:Zinc finger BED domain-containing protein 4, partial [Cyphomyrmex costatus]